MSSRSGKTDKHMWTLEEDELLIQSMMVLHDKGELISDNGLRPRVLNTLKDMLDGLIPESGIKAYPHIQSRVKKLKINYGVVSDLLNLSGFGWDPEKKCVTAPKTVWDEYVKVNKKAAKWRNKTFPHYDELSNIFGKDRATGKDAQTYEDIVEEFHDQHGFTSPIEDTPTEHILTDSQMDGSHANTSPQENSPTELSPSDATFGAKKRKRNSTEAQPSMLEGMKMIVQTLTNGLKESSEHFGMHLDRVEREKRIDGMRSSLLVELKKVEGLSHQERLKAYVKIIGDENILIGFYSMPEEDKADVIREIIA
ncbi:uncharacterized protein At2g29880-like [Prosopis cineraria]|uniref:uncharacterized protein At2g29880-like n=1 Tax=Prosopis cineraria TaxID=364024 RepID=UPI0024108575|nr:uncharacterized protein At2g29880-like [Prosopis cineraria]